MSKSFNVGTSILTLSALGAFFAIYLRPHDTVALVTFFLSTYTSWEYHKSELYMNYMKAEWAKLPEVEPSPIIEFTLANFSREALLRLTNNLADPVVIRAAVAESIATQLWSRDHFLENYANESIVVREILDGEGTEPPIVRMQGRSFSDFYTMKDNGRNVSSVASSSVFFRNPKFALEIQSVIESDLVGPNKEPIMANQLFICPGGRTWFHSEIANNVFRQIAGQKRWNVISPAHSFWMCPKPVISGTSVNPECILNMDPDAMENHIKRIPRQTALLNPGDILINAPWWWHDVQGIGSGDDPQVSVAGRIKNLKSTFTNSPMLTFVAFASKITSAWRTGQKLALDKDRVPLELEQNILESWYKNCVALGRADCVTSV